MITIKTVMEKVEAPIKVSDKNGNLVQNGYNPEEITLLNFPDERNKITYEKIRIENNPDLEKLKRKISDEAIFFYIIGEEKTKFPQEATLVTYSGEKYEYFLILGCKSVYICNSAGSTISVINMYIPS